MKAIPNRKLAASEAFVICAVLSMCLIATFLASQSIGIVALFLAGAGLLAYATYLRDAKLAAAGGMIAVFAVWLGWARWGITLLYEQIITVDVKSVPGKEAPSILEQLGQLGDLFGAINALFASFAFIGVALAAYFQYRTAQMMESQLTQQSFEPLFFKLLDRAVPPADLIVKDARCPKSAACEALSEELRYQLLCYSMESDSRLRQSYKKWVGEHCDSFYKKNESELGPFFRKLYHVFKFIHLSPLDLQQKSHYSNIARAALSKDDLTLISANLQTAEGKHFIPLIEYYGLLKHIPNNSIGHQLARLELKDSAFMSASDRLKYWAQRAAEFDDLELSLKYI